MYIAQHLNPPRGHQLKMDMYFFLQTLCWAPSRWCGVADVMCLCSFSDLTSLLTCLPYPAPPNHCLLDRTGILDTCKSSAWDPWFGCSSSEPIGEGCFHSTGETRRGRPLKQRHMANSLAQSDPLALKLSPSQLPKANPLTFWFPRFGPYLVVSLGQRN